MWLILFLNLFGTTAKAHSICFPFLTSSKEWHSSSLPQYVQGPPLPLMWHWPLPPQNQPSQSAFLTLHLLGTQMLFRGREISLQIRQRIKHSVCPLKTSSLQRFLGWRRSNPKRLQENLKHRVAVPPLESGHKIRHFCQKSLNWLQCEKCTSMQANNTVGLGTQLYTMKNSLQNNYKKITNKLLLIFFVAWSHAGGKYIHSLSITAVKYCIGWMKNVGV